MDIECQLAGLERELLNKKFKMASPCSYIDEFYDACIDVKIMTRGSTYLLGDVGKGSRVARGLSSHMQCLGVG